MARTLLRVRSKGVAFYLNSETSPPIPGIEIATAYSRRKITAAKNRAGFKWVRLLVGS